MEKGNNWHGGRWKHKGYVFITVAEPHPRFGTKVPEHVLIVKKVLGRHLRYVSQTHADNEIVHHVNETRDDNRRENFVICTHAYHVALHRRMTSR